jgi:CheY-like chemotaxis protein
MSEANAATPLNSLSVLVVDDNSDARIIFSTVLRQAGAIVNAVSSATTAARRLTHLRPDVVITDLSMPRRDGLWLLQWIRNRDRKRKTHTPVIAVTARDDIYDIGDLRFDSCLLKPVAWNALLRAILLVTSREISASA